MNKLVRKLKKDNIPVLFTYKDIYGLGIEENKLKYMFEEAIKNECIGNIYKDIYALIGKYRKTYLSMETISQKIIPNSYVSTHYVLSEEGWIPDGIFSMTCVTFEESIEIDCERYGYYIYYKLYEKELLDGTYIDEDYCGFYRKAKPLRALCDLIYLRKESWRYIHSLEDNLRIDTYELAKLKSEDFDELQGKFNIKNVEEFLEGIRKELNV